MNTALGVGAAAVERSRGGCYAVCTGDTACNSDTGFCEPLPCGGRCGVNETCTPTPTGEECVPNVRDLLSHDETPAHPDVAPTDLEGSLEPKQ